MPIIKFISIRYKLVFLMMLITILTVGVASSLFYKNEVEILEGSAIKSGQTQATMVGFSIKSAIIFDDSSSAVDTLSLFEHNEQIAYAEVYLPDGEVFAEYEKTNSDKNLAINHGNDYKQFVEKTLLGDTFLEVTTPIHIQNETLGYLYLKMSLDELKQQRAYYRQMLFYVLSLSCFLAALFSFIAQRVITHPLNIMVNYVQELSHKKDYSKRLNLNLKDELGTLTTGFNHMLNVVEEREKALKTQSSNLQNIVDQRTEQLYQKAHFDSLTLLPNRYLLADRLEHAIFTAKRRQKSLGILFLDLDRFKIINDSLGHYVGDQLLKEAAIRLQKLGRDSDTIARLGGDEFIYLVEDISKPEDAGRIAEKINESFREPFVLNNHVLHISTSIGISLFPGDGDNSTQLLKNADISMYHAKDQGAGNYCFYKSDMNEAMHERLAIENELRCAIQNNEFYLLYQPICDIKTSKINKVEALLRWNNPRLGLVSPAVFIPIVEEIGMINEVGKWVVNEVCRQQALWGDKQIKVAVNVSSNQLLDVNLIDYVQTITIEHKTQLSSLEFEITEEVFLKNSKQTINRLSQLRELGISIAIDDFGTGYSSLSYLKELPIDTLKLDGMFVMDLPESQSSQGIVSATIILAHSLNINIVAECVETEEQLAFLKDKNCDLVQGYYLHKPLLPADVIQLV